jgi:MarR family 2-MHQ and catechol resistance regulon transcriptional repressor
MDEISSLVEERSRDPAMLTWYRFVRVLRKITSMMDGPMQSLGVSRSQFDLLVQIAFDEGVNQQTCAERMDLTKGNIAQHVYRLEKKGFITRRKEGRTNSLFLTKEGSGLMAKVIPYHDRHVREILSVLSREELTQFQSILRKFDRDLN